MFSRKLALAVLLAGTAVSVAIACGPEFPWQSLNDRSVALTKVPANSFAFEAAHLIPTPKDELTPVEGNYWETDRSEERDKAEREGLTDAQLAALAAMRASGKANAFGRGEGLPPAVRLYTAGAVAFRAGDPALAAGRFEEVLRLPDEDRKSRAVWAAYMLGRATAAQDDHGAARRAFALTRDLARGGAPDPLGLAVTSFGEEAKLHLARAEQLKAEGNGVAFASAIASAVTLYAEQAARGADGGVQSLRMVAEGLFADPSRLESVVVHPIVQRLLVAYALAHPPQTPGGLGFDERTNALIDAVEEQGIAHVAGADRLAALAYRSGLSDLARRCADRQPGPLSSWVKAKLALQEDDLPKAAALLAEASRAFPEASETVALAEPSRTDLQGERGTLALARGEYINALDLLYPMGEVYWAHVAHIAERVLRVDELKAFVDERNDIPANLRDLLARRLMREGHPDEALAYYKDPAVAAYAADHTKARRAAEGGWWPSNWWPSNMWRIDRARALFQAAMLARWHGMEIMGTEGAPDYFVVEGAFEGILGPQDLSGPYITKAEIRRFEDSRPKPYLRFHYRYIAEDLATQAADLLPPRSQAFAAVLCHATGWMLSSHDDERVRALYARYVEQGALVDWATHFGRDCPDPDFDGASSRRPAYLWLDLREWLRSWLG